MLLDAKDTLLVVVDAQASLMPLVFETKRIITATNKLATIAREVSVPIVITEHYPEGLKPTVPEIARHLGEDYKPIKKRVFSCFGSEEFISALESSGRKTLLLTGIETHICILQTALQGLERGYSVFLALDGISSRSKVDHSVALGRMSRAGIELITWEMAAYEWLRRADTPEFKKVLPHIKSGLNLG